MSILILSLDPDHTANRFALKSGAWMSDTVDTTKGERKQLPTELRE
jgi:hypothetical protein